MLSKRFPYSIYYDIIHDNARIVAVLDQRQHPLNNYTQLAQRQ